MQIGESRVMWSLPQMPMFSGKNVSQERNLPSILSFDAMMNAPQGCPVAVRMQRDAAARVQQQPLVNFFRNALGLAQKGRRVSYLCPKLTGADTTPPGCTRQKSPKE
jgi:hypothetical protein